VVIKHSQYIKSKNNNVFNTGFCIVCNTPKFVKDFFRDVRYWEYPDKFEYWKCYKCGLIFQKYVVKSNLGKYYENSSYWSQDMDELKSKGLLDKYNWDKFGNIYKFIIENKKKGNILDIGCGSGNFLSMFNRKDWQVFGFDISDFAGKTALKYFNIKIFKPNDILKKNFKRKYDVITMLNSIEHFYEPLLYLERVKNVIKDDGYLIIQVPNISSLGFLIFGKYWYPLQPGRHLFNFNPSNLKKLVEEFGFKVIKIDHFNKNHSIYGIFQSIRYINKGKRKENQVVHINFEKEVLKKEKLPNEKYIFVVIANLLSNIIYYLGAFLKKGEYITIYAQREN